MKLNFTTILFLIIPFFGITQNFELKKPNVTELSEGLKNIKYSQDVTYLYLQRNYKVISEKQITTPT
jgi:hypothetical protein